MSARSEAKPSHNCPACGHDVSTTLGDGLTVCPECGGAIDAASCSWPSVDDRAIERFQIHYAIPVSAIFVCVTFLPVGLALGTLYVAGALVLCVVGGTHSARTGGLLRGRRGRAIRVMLIFGEAFGILLYALLFWMLASLVIESMISRFT